MNDQFTDALSDWLASRAPASAPDRILDAVAARVDDLDQRQAAPWSRLAAAAVLILLVGLTGALVFAGLGRVGDPSPTPSADAASIRIACPTAPCEFPLVEGARYATARLEEPIDLQTASDRWLVTRDTPGAFQVEIGRDARRAITVFTDPHGVDPVGDPVDVELPDAASVADWLAQREDLSVSAPTAVTLGGLSGLQVDLHGEPSPLRRATDCYEPEVLCTAALGYAEEPGVTRSLGVSSLDLVRLYLLDGPDGVIVVAVTAFHEAPATFVDGEAAELLATFRIGQQD
jgi:hypothetical protein